ncbi:MAG: hypothetical protein HY852_24570 [Bradyrhizobium sp.]|uniref:hypothetical protein n=1 Tax=Bradyrhizobium sp. TaxID=376 RepID=UPI0025C14566|nr:hypothetical protein [Bradyrhizobium sp.]MBI5264981.1 hypothetical protein [Bradyrhizobium sp.]
MSLIHSRNPVYWRMDLRLSREHLVQAERHIALSDKAIARQIQIIDELEVGGHPTVLALDLLATFHAARAIHVAHRDLIRKELEP